MKKILPYIFIFLIIANLFAPLTVGVGKNNTPVVKQSVAEAAESTITITEQSSTENTINLSINIVRETSDNHGFYFMITDKPGTTLSTELFDVDGSSYTLSGLVGAKIADTTLTDEKQILIPATGAKNVYSGAWVGDAFPEDETKTINGKDYSIVTSNIAVPNLQADTPYYISTWIFNGTYTDNRSIQFKNDYSPVRTSAAGQTSSTSTAVGKSNTTGELMPECGVGIISGTLGGCIAQILYYLLFLPTSYLFSLTGVFFDWTFNYSISDQSYRSEFVVQGWGLVRDFCNIFFIFVLLYIAFSTILNLHGFKTKEMIVNVVVIGLLINFSLFAAQLIIDTSNILARVFYNSNAIKITTGDNAANGVSSHTPGLEVGPNGELPLSAALVNKVNPQNLILSSSKVNILDSNKTADIGGASIGVGTFILVTLLATAINVVGLIVFLSVGLIFIARVIGLWIYMIFAALAFFSYMVPSLQGIEMIGWKRWWPELISMSFLAPIFIFFLYLILKFLEKGLGLISAGNSTGMQFVIGIVVPFAFIMILLMKAKDIAKKMSGSIGQGITNGVAAVGGIALGAGMGAAAFAGRSTIGRLAAKADKSNWLNDTAAGKRGNWATQRLAKFGKKSTSYVSGASFDTRQTGIANTLSKHSGMNLNKGTSVLGLDTKKGLGGYKGSQDRKVEKENKFAESLGYDHHKTENIEESINIRKDALDVAEAEQSRAKAAVDMAKGDKKAEKTANIAYAAAQNKVANIKSGDPTKTGNDAKSLATMEKDLERVKTGRQKEYTLMQKRKSGKIYDNVKRDTNENIISFGHATEAKGLAAGKQAMKEFAEGFLKGAATGAVAGSIVPGIGTAFGGIAGGIAGGIRDLSKYSGTTNQHVGEKHADKHESPKDKYKFEAAAPEKHDDHSAGDSHATPHH